MDGSVASGQQRSAFSIFALAPVPRVFVLTRSIDWCCFAAWDVADEHLANLFGLNESKYEWAVREYYWQKRQEKEHICEVLNSSPSQVNRDGHCKSVLCRALPYCAYLGFCI